MPASPTPSSPTSTSPPPSAVEADTAPHATIRRAVSATAARTDGCSATGTAPDRVELDCRFQTICEGCGFYETGAEFVTILRRQRDDATAHADAARTKLYDELVSVIDDTTID